MFSNPYGDALQKLGIQQLNMQQQGDYMAMRQDFQRSEYLLKPEPCDYCGTSRQEHGRCVSCGAPKRSKKGPPMTLGTISYDLPGIRGSFPECLHPPITIKP